jgi:hypothetical protein
MRDGTTVASAADNRQRQPLRRQGASSRRRSGKPPSEPTGAPRTAAIAPGNFAATAGQRRAPQSMPLFQSVAAPWAANRNT